MTLKQQASSGIKWNGLAMVVIFSLQFATLMVLARLLSPSDFGLMGMITVVIGFANGFSDFGLSNAIIHRQDVTESQISTCFWISILVGVFIFFLILLIRPLLVMYFKEEALHKYMFFAALMFLIAPIAQLFTTLLKKDFKFATIAKIEIVEAAVYSAATIGLALGQFGVLSLLLGGIISSLSTLFILLWIFRKQRILTLHFSIKEIQGFLQFGSFQMGERTVNFLRANIDYMIIGRFLGPEALGYYSLAYRIITFPMSKINPAITRVAFPIFSSIQDDNERIRIGYCEIIKFLSMIAFPMLAGIIVVAPDFIPVFYGAKWEPSVMVVQILCMVGMVWVVLDPTGSVLLAKGKANIGFYWNAFAAIITSVAIIIGVNWGICGVAWSIFVLQLPFLLILQPIVNRLIDLKFRNFLGAIKIPFYCSVLMALGTAAAKSCLGNVNIGIGVVLVVYVAVGICIYVFSYYFFDRETFVEAKSFLKVKNESTTDR